MRPLTAPSLIALLASAIAAVVLMGLGGYVLVATPRPWLFGLTLFMIGAIAGALVFGGFLRHRPSWAFLIATWSIVGFCAFFTAPKVMALPKIRQVDVALEETMGRQKAEEYIDRANFRARMKVLGVCLGFLAPFAAMSAAFAIGRRDFERTV